MRAEGHASIGQRKYKICRPVRGRRGRRRGAEKEKRKRKRKESEGEGREKERKWENGKAKKQNTMSCAGQRKVNAAKPGQEVSHARTGTGAGTGMHAYIPLPHFLASSNFATPQ